MAENAVRYCAECGAQLRREAVFCAQCGQSNALRSDPSEDRPSFDPRDALPKTKRNSGLLKKLILAAIAIGLPVGGVAYYNQMRVRYGADFNFDGYITPKEVSDYADEYVPWEARGTWRFRPLTMYGSSEMRHVAERLDTTKEVDFPFMSQMYRSLQLGDQDILPLRMDQCLITKYNVTRSSQAGASYDGIEAPYKELEVELDCSSQCLTEKEVG